MNRDQVAEAFALVAACYDLDPLPATIKGWYIMLKDLDADSVFTATKLLCARDTPFAPKPGEIIAQVERMNGKTPPTIEAATGYFESGQWDIHACVAEAAQQVCWDRTAAPDQARWQFRSLYRMVLDKQERKPLNDVIAIDSGDNPLNELQ